MRDAMVAAHQEGPQTVVVAVQEIASNTDADRLLSLASHLQSPYATVAPGGPSGSDRAAFMSDLPPPGRYRLDGHVTVWRCRRQ